MIKKIGLTVLMTAVLVAGVFASGQQEKKAAEDSQEEVVLKVAYPVAVDAPVADILNGYATEFKKTHPNVTIEPVYAGGYTDVKTMIQTSIDGGGDAPELAVMLATDVYDLANAQYIEPLSDLLANMEGSDAYLDDFLPVFLENSYYQDKLWSLPFQRSAVVAYYNADLFKAAGLSEPKNLQELADAAQALTVREGDSVTRWGIEWPTGWPYWVFQPLAMAFGKNIVGADDTTVYFNEPEVIDAINYYNDLSAKYQATPAGVQGTWGNVVPNFLSGNTAIIVQTSGSLSKILSNADFEVGVMGIPGKTSGSYSVPGGGNIYMTSGLSDAEKRAALDFAVFMTSPENAAQFSIATGYIATSKSAFSSDAMKAYSAEHPQVAKIKDILADAGKELAIQNLGQVRSIFHNYIQAAFNGEMTAAEAMAKAQEEADAALADFK
ncbi:MAG: ABC transporter substrate-binding protein [Spirochaetales bacterium]|nr:ABC transporter substrate-binding protein [Spirochaetales bacterium]